MKIGDRVRVIGVPDVLPRDQDGLKTTSLFQICVGRVFPIAGFNETNIWIEVDCGLEQSKN
jgi:hypothetical protein